MIVEQISALERLLPGAHEGPNNWAHPCGRLRFCPARSNNHPPIQQPIICACRFPLSLVCVLSPNVYLAKTKGLRVLELKHKSKVRRSVYYAHRTTRIGAIANGLAATSHGDVPCHHPPPRQGLTPAPPVVHKPPRCSHAQFHPAPSRFCNLLISCSMYFS